MPDLPPWLQGLNPQQLQAVTHGDGPLLIIAGAGTGKTNTLAHRVAWLIHQGVQPGRILLLTFTRRAAQEMLNRAQAAVGRLGWDVPLDGEPAAPHVRPGGGTPTRLHGDG